MKTEKFKIIQFIRELLLMIDKQMDNFSKKDIELKNRIRTNSFDMLEIAYEANTTTNVELKKDLLNKIIAKVKVIDFLLNLSLDKGLIPLKKYYKLGNKMEDIVKYTFGWMNSINANSAKSKQRKQESTASGTEAKPT